MVVFHRDSLLCTLPVDINVVTTPVKQVSTCTQEESICLVIMADLGLDVGHSGESTYHSTYYVADGRNG